MVTDPRAVPDQSAAELALEKAARTALSFLLYRGPGAYSKSETVEALADALEPYNAMADARCDMCQDVGAAYCDNCAVDVATVFAARSAAVDETQRGMEDQ